MNAHLAFANRLRFFLTPLLFAMSLLGSPAVWALPPVPAPPLAVAPAPAATETCTDYAKRVRGFHGCAWKKYFSIGPALSAVSVNMKTAKLGLFDTAAALELHGSNLQYVKTTSFRSSDGLETVNLALWEWAFGIQVKKAQDSSDVSFGIYGVPYGIRVNDFAIGLGLLYTNIGSLGWSWEHFNLILPVTYQFSI